jgi:hypothetical protein
MARSMKSSNERLSVAAPALCLALLACLLAPGSPAISAPVTIPLNYQTVAGPALATGTAVVDDSLLAPNTDTGQTTDLSGLVSFSLQVTNLTPAPHTTSFSTSDLVGWVLHTDGDGRLVDLNFFMLIVPAGKVNTDGYAVQGHNAFRLAIWYGQVGLGEQLAEFLADPPGRARDPIPMLSEAGIIALILLIGWVAVLIARRVQ